jgi:hypothetical protein
MKLNKNKLYYDIKNHSEKLRGTLNYILGKKEHTAPSFIESEGSFIKTPTDIANDLKTSYGWGQY